MKSNRIVFIPVIAVLAGLSAFVAVLLICLDLVPAIAGEREGVAKAREKSREVQKRSESEVKEVGREVAEFGSKAEDGDRGRQKPEARPEPKRRAPESAERGDAPGEDVKRQFMQKRTEVKMLHDSGKHDAAERAENELREWAREHHLDAGGPAPERRPGLEAEARKREMAERQEREHHGRAPEPPVGERIGHLIEASEHLKLAGFAEAAEEWRHRAEELKERNRAVGEDERVVHLMQRVEELQAAMGKMREEMRRLHGERN